MNNPNSEQSSTPKSITDLVDLPDEQRQIVNWITHQQKVTLTEIAANINQTEAATEEILQTLISDGFLQAVNESDLVYYQPRFINKQKSKLSQKIWDKL